MFETCQRARAANSLRIKQLDWNVVPDSEKQGNLDISTTDFTPPWIKVKTYLVSQPPSTVLVETVAKDSESGRVQSPNGKGVECLKIPRRGQRKIKPTTRILTSPRRDNSVSSSQTSGGRMTNEESSGVLRRLVLSTAGFFEFLFSDRWEEGCLLRVLPGKLQNNLFHGLVELARYHEIFSYVTLVTITSPIDRCIKTKSQEQQCSTESSNVRKVLVELEYFCPELRPPTPTEMESQLTLASYEEESSWAELQPIHYKTRQKTTVPDQEGSKTQPTSTVPDQEGSETQQTSTVPDQEKSKTEQTSTVPDQEGSETQQTSKVPDQEKSKAGQTSEGADQKRKTRQKSKIADNEKSKSRHKRKVPDQEKSETPRKTKVPHQERSKARHKKKVPDQEKSETRQTTTVPDQESSESLQTSKVPDQESSETGQTTTVPDQETSKTRQTSKVADQQSSETQQTSKVSDQESSETRQTTTVPDQKMTAQASSSREQDTKLLDAGWDFPPGDQTSTEATPEPGRLKLPEPESYRSNSSTKSAGSVMRGPGQELEFSTVSRFQVDDQAPPPHDEHDKPAPLLTSSFSKLRRSYSVAPPHSRLDLDRLLPKKIPPISSFYVGTSAGLPHESDTPDTVVTKVDDSVTMILRALPHDGVKKREVDKSMKVNISSVSALSAIESGSVASSATLQQQKLQEAASGSSLKEETSEYPRISQCNIRGQSRPPPHTDCFSQFHMVREPFFERRHRELSAFPPLQVPQRPETPDTFVYKWSDRWEDDAHLGRSKDDDTEVVCCVPVLEEYPIDDTSSISSKYSSVFSKQRAQIISSLKREDTKISGVEATKKRKGDDDDCTEDADVETPQWEVDADRVKELKRDIDLMCSEFFVDKPGSNTEEEISMKEEQKQGVSEQTPVSMLSTESKKKRSAKSKKPKAKKKKKRAPTVYPDSFVKKWEECPDFHHFYYYLNGMQETDIQSLIEARRHPEVLPEVYEWSLNRPVSDGKRISFADENKLSVGERRLSVRERKQSVRERKQSARERKHSHSVREKKHSVREKKYSVREKKLSVRERKLTVGENKSVGEKKISVEEKKLSVGEKKQSVGEKKLSVEEKKMSVGEKKLSVGEKKLSVGEKKISVEERKQLVDNRKVSGDEEKMGNSHNTAEEKEAKRKQSVYFQKTDSDKSEEEKTSNTQINDTRKKSHEKSEEEKTTGKQKSPSHAQTSDGRKSSKELSARITVTTASPTEQPARKGPEQKEQSDTDTTGASQDSASQKSTDKDRHDNQHTVVDSSPIVKTTKKKKKLTVDVDRLNKMSAGKYCLTEEEDTRIKDARLAVSNIDPWHIYVPIAYLHKHMHKADIEDDRLKRCEVLHKLIEGGKVILQLNKTRVWSLVRQIPPEYREHMRTDSGKTGKERDIGLQNRDLSEADTKINPKHKLSGEQRSVKQTASGQSALQTHFDTQSKNLIPNAPLPFIDDNLIPKKIKEQDLFNLMKVDEVFDITNLKSTYSFEKMFAPQMNSVPGYKSRLAKYQNNETKKKNEPRNNRQVNRSSKNDKKQRNLPSAIDSQTSGSKNREQLNLPSPIDSQTSGSKDRERLNLPSPTDSRTSGSKDRERLNLPSPIDSRTSGSRNRELLNLPSPTDSHSIASKNTVQILQQAVPPPSGSRTQENESPWQGECSSVMSDMEGVQDPDVINSEMFHHLCLALKSFVVRKERATTVKPVQSIVSITFSRRAAGTPETDITSALNDSACGRHLVTALCQTLSITH